MNDAGSALNIEPPSIDSPKQEGYIPWNVDDFIDLIAAQFADPDEALSPFRTVCDRLRDSVHSHYRPRYESALKQYRSVDPDEDDINIPGEDPVLLTGVSDTELLEPLRELICRAGYQRLTPMQIQASIQQASRWGVHLRIRFSMFQVLEVYARGDTVDQRPYRAWTNAFRLRQMECPIYQRVVVIIQPSDNDLQTALDPRKLHLRMFKNVPKADVDMLLPSKGIRFTWWDTGRIGIPTVWGFTVLVSKLIKNIWLLTVLIAIKVMTSFIIGTAIVVAAVVYGVKSIFAYLTTKRRYLLHVTQNLYYQNLANNLGVLLRLLSEAEEQEILHAIVVLFVISRQTIEVQPEVSSNGKILQEACDTFVRELTGGNFSVDFQGGIQTLYRAGMIQWTDRGWVQAI